MSQFAKKLDLILAASTLIIKTSMKADLILAPSLESPVLDNSTSLLKHVPYIHYLVWFKKDLANFQALLDYGNKVNVVTLAYILN